MPLCVQHPAFILRPVSRNVPPVQLTQINTEMEGWEEMRISIQSRVITCCKSGNQSMQYLFFKEPGFAGWDRLTCKKRQQMLAFLPKAREEKDSFKKQKTTPSRRLELRKELISAVSAVQLSCGGGRWAMEKLWARTQEPFSVSRQSSKNVQTW